MDWASVGQRFEALVVDMDVSYSGLDANGARRGEQFDPAVLYRMVQEGATLAAIGAEIGYTREGVRLIIQRRGWTELRVENARKKRERERAETHRRRVLELLADGRGVSATGLLWWLDVSMLL